MASSHVSPAAVRFNAVRRCATRVLVFAITGVARGTDGMGDNDVNADDVERTLGELRLVGDGFDVGEDVDVADVVMTCHFHEVPFHFHLPAGVGNCSA